MKCINCGRKINQSYCEYCGTVNTYKEETVESKNVDNKPYDLSNIGKISSSKYDEKPKTKGTDNKIFNSAFFKRILSEDVDIEEEKNSIIATIIFLFLFSPVGVIMLWTKRHFKRDIRIILTLIFSYSLIVESTKIIKMFIEELF